MSKLNILKMFVVLLFVFALSACTPENPEITYTLDLENEEVSLSVGEEVELPGVTTNGTIKVEVVSEGVIAYENGKIKALSCGEATVKLSVEEDATLTAELKVTVTADIEASLDAENLYPGSEANIVLAGVAGVTISEVLVSDPTVVEVAEGKVKALKVGTTTLTIKTSVNAEVVLEVEVKPTPAITLNGPESALVEGETFQLVTNFNTDGDEVAEYISSNENIATVTKEGLLTAIAGGEVTITVKSAQGAEASIVVTVEIDYSKIESLEVEVVCEDDDIYFDSKISLNVKAYPEGMSNEFTYRVKSGSNYITIDEDLNITFKASKEVVIEFTSVHNKKVKASITLLCTSYINPTKYLSTLNYDEVILHKAFCTGFENNGASSYWFYLVGSVNLLYFDNIEITEMWLSETAPNYDGRTMDRIRYITVHDTAAASPTSTALANGGWCTNPTNDGSSWHYTLGNDGIYQHLKNNQVAWHAGDGTATKLQFTNTHVPATSDEPAVVTVSSDGYWELNGVKSDVKAPLAGGRIATNADLPYTGINNYVGTDGNYWISNTWWSSTYQTLSNRGGNLNSIGIETAINKGSNLYLTWSMLAKFVGGKLCVETGLTPRDVKQHNTFSGKNCPQTMREAGMWEMFMERVNAEWKLAKYFKGWSMTMEIDCEYVGADGLITHLPDAATPVQYKIILSNGEKSYEQVFNTVIPARPADFDNPLAL